MSEQHTPLPWQISEAKTVEGTTIIVGGEGFGFGLIADVTSAEDAAFILKAVSSHDGMTYPQSKAFYVNIYRGIAGSCGSVYETRELADQMAGIGRIACKEICVGMGEGLDSAHQSARVGVEKSGNTRQASPELRGNAE